MHKWFLAFGGASGALGVAGGALGAHLLDQRLDAAAQHGYDTGVTYLLLHAAVLTALAASMRGAPGSPWLTIAGCAFVAGIILFSGSLILMPLTGYSGLRAFAPAGGMSLICGWLMVVIGALRSPGRW